MNKTTKNLQNAKQIVLRLKELLGCKRDLQLAELLGISPTTLSTWKSRNSMDYHLVIEFCSGKNFDLNYVLLGITSNSVGNGFEKYDDSIFAKLKAQFENQIEDVKSVRIELEQLLEKIKTKDEIDRAKTRIKKVKGAQT